MSCIYHCTDTIRLPWILTKRIAAQPEPRGRLSACIEPSSAPRSNREAL